MQNLCDKNCQMNETQYGLIQCNALQSNVCPIKSVKLGDDATPAAEAMCKVGMTLDKWGCLIIVISKPYNTPKKSEIYWTK